jgi:hypothetical protein
MTEQLEADLREALSRCASGIPSDAGARLRAIDYHPRRSRISPRLKVGTLAGAAVTTGTVLSVVILGGASPAFAGWTASPTAASASQTTSADASCQAQLASLAALSGSADGTPWTAVATDVRGPFTLVVYQDGSSDATCLSGPSLTAVSTSSGSRASESVSGSASGTGDGSGLSSISRVAGSGSDGIEQATVAHLDSTSDGAYTVIDGQLDADVTGVTLVRSDGEDIQASAGSGWFVAWWPGSLDATSAEITTPGGVTTETLNTPAQPPLPSGSGSGSCDQNSPTGATTCSGASGGSGTGGASTGSV